MNPIIYVVAAILVSVLLWFVTRQSGKKNEEQADEETNVRQENQGAVQVGGRRRRQARMGIQRHAQDLRQQEEDSDKDEDAQSYTKDSKIGTKKLKKLQEKEERKRQRELEAQEREERKKEQQEQDEMRKVEEEKRRKEEEKIMDEKKKEAEEKERQEHEEYLKLKAMFSVDEEGQQEVTSDEQSHNLLQEFVEYIKQKKVVLLEDLASHFGLRTQDAIDRVQTMLKDEILTGVIDDRGKFIYISHEELQAVAKYIDQHGRVSISDLAQASNSLINLVTETAAAN